MIDTKELRALTQAVSGWSNCNHAWLDTSEDVAAAVVGHIDESGETYPVATIDCDQYYAAHQSLPLAKFYAAANPATISELLDRLEAAEKERDNANAAAVNIALEAERLQVEIDALRAKIEAAEKSDAESLAMYRKARDERDALRAALRHEADCVEACKSEIERLRAKLEAAEKTNREWLRANAPGGWIDNLRIENEALRAEVIHIKEVEFPRKAQAVADGWRGKCERLEAKIAAMEQQEPVGVLHVGSYYGEELEDWEFEANQCACDKLNEAYVHNPTSLPLYALPGARPNDEALWQTIVNGMITPAHTAQAVADGTITPAYIMQPAPSVPDGFSREDLEAVADGLDGYEKTVNVGNVTGGGDGHLESTTAYAARFIRAMLAAAPEAKP